MKNAPFFSGITRAKISWREHEIKVPVFYYDLTSLMVYMLAPIKKVKAILPSARMNPYRVTPWHCIIVIAAYAYRDSDIGPYNEVLFGVPFVMDRAPFLLEGVLRQPSETPMMYIHRLPVTTEIARAAGVELAGFPKFLADISFESTGEALSCRVNADGKHILTLAGPKIKLRQFPRQRVYSITAQQDRLLRMEVILSECEAGISRLPSGVRLELGDHRIAQELRDLNLGGILAYQYCPQGQAILTTVCESYTV